VCYQPHEEHAISTEPGVDDGDSGIYATEEEERQHYARLAGTGSTGNLNGGVATHDTGRVTTNVTGGGAGGADYGAPPPVGYRPQSGAYQQQGTTYHPQAATYHPQGSTYPSQGATYQPESAPYQAQGTTYPHAASREGVASPPRGHSPYATGSPARVASPHRGGVGSPARVVSPAPSRSRNGTPAPLSPAHSVSSGRQGGVSPIPSGRGVSSPVPFKGGNGGGIAAAATDPGRFHEQF
jgi:hypothetical protein